LRFSTRGLIVAVAIIGYDAAAMIRVVQQGRAVHSLREYVIGFGAILLILNLVVLGLYIYFSKRADASTGSRLLATPSPVIIAGLYMAVLAFAILSILFFTSGRF